MTLQKTPIISAPAHLSTGVRHALDRHPYFGRVTDPESGVPSYILTKHAAPLQQQFYFTNASVTRDEKWLWFYASFPPARSRTLGLVSLDPDHPVIRHFPHAEFSSASPLVAPDGKGIYYCLDRYIYHMTNNGDISVVAALDEQWVNHRPIGQMATHLTLSADGQYLLLDGQVGTFWFVGTAHISTGKIQILKEFVSNHNHAQFSPVDPELFLIAEDWWRDRATGQYFPIDHRIWLMDIRGRRYEPLRPKEWYNHDAYPSHEWWSETGKICWVDYAAGAYECDIATGEAVNVWPRPLCHAHCNADSSLWCADQSPYTWDQRPCDVLLMDRTSGRELRIASLPKPTVPRDPYHPDPHPQFSPQGTWVVYTTTVRQTLDIALCPVAEALGLLESE